MIITNFYSNLTTNMAANVVSPANDFSSLAPKRISYVTGGLITAAIGIAMMPWKLYAVRHYPPLTGGITATSSPSCRRVSNRA